MSEKLPVTTEQESHATVPGTHLSVLQARAMLGSLQQRANTNVLTNKIEHQLNFLNTLGLTAHPITASPVLLLTAAPDLLETSTDRYWVWPVQAANTGEVDGLSEVECHPAWC